MKVVGYDPQQGLQTFEMVSSVLAFDHLRDGQVYHLVFHQAIYMPQLDHHLLCPMQCRVNDMTVNDVPKFLTHFPTDNMHALIVQNPDDDSITLSFPHICRERHCTCQYASPQLPNGRQGTLSGSI